MNKRYGNVRIDATHYLANHPAVLADKIGYAVDMIKTAFPEMKWTHCKIEEASKLTITPDFFFWIETPEYPPLEEGEEAPVIASIKLNGDYAFVEFNEN